MKHGYAGGDYRMTTMQESPAWKFGGPIKIGEASTYIFRGYKESIIEFLLKPENIDRVLEFRKNTSKDEYGTEFSDSNLHVIFSNLVSGPTTPGGAIVESVRQAAGGIATGVITGTIAALGAGARTVVQIYEIASGANSMLNIGTTITDLAGKQMYKNKLTRQIHHKFHSRIEVALQGRVSPSKVRAHKVIDTGGTAITCGALAVLISERF